MQWQEKWARNGIGNIGRADLCHRDREQGERRTRMVRENFNRNWQVMKGGSNAAAAAFMGTDEVHKVHLPHDAMIHE